MSSPIEHFQRFFPESSVLNFEKLGNGHINETFKVDFSTGGDSHSVIFQQVNRKIFAHPEKIVSNINLVAAHLRQNRYRYQILDVLLSPNVASGDSWRVLPYFDHCKSLLTCDDAIQAERSAGIFAHHLYCLSDLDPNRLNVIIPDFHNASLRWKQFEDALEKADDQQKKSAQQAIQFCFDNRFVIDLFEQIHPELPIRVTHNDSKISNLLSDSKSLQPRVIIDLDTLQPGTVLSEFGDMVRSYCPSHGEEETNFEHVQFRSEIFLALKQSFQAETTSILTLTEQEALNHAGVITIFVQALRFLTDYLNGDVYYGFIYPGQNLNRALNQQHLLVQMMTWQKNQTA